MKVPTPAQQYWWAKQTAESAQWWESRCSQNREIEFWEGATPVGLPVTLDTISFTIVEDRSDPRWLDEVGLYDELVGPNHQLPLAHPAVPHDDGFEHGTVVGYQYHHCRCTSCRTAKTEYDRRRRRRKSVDAARAMGKMGT